MWVVLGIYPQRFWIKCAFACVFLAACRSPEVRRAVFRANIYGGLTSLDPAFARTEANAWIVGRIYDPLLRLNDSLRVVPALARSYRVSQDGLEYTFELRRDAFFHPHVAFGGDSTRRADARDVVFSFTRLVDARVASPGQWLFNQCVEGVKEFREGEAQTVSGFRAPNDSTFVLRLSRPFAPLLRMLASPYASIVPREAPTAGIGTGPFRLKSWREGRSLILLKNSRYFGAVPQLDAVVFRFIGGKTSAFHEFLRGGLDYLDAPDPALVEELFLPDGTLKPGYAQRFEAQSLAQMTTEYIGLFAGDDFAALNDARVRRALSLAIDRRRLVRPPITAVPTGGFIPEGVPGRQPVSAPVYDPDSARKLIQAAGARWPRPLTLLTNPAYRLQAERIQKYWSQIGVPTQIQEMDGAALRERVVSGSARAWRASWVADYPDPENFFALFASFHVPPHGPNYTRFSHPQYDSLYRVAAARPNPEVYVRMEEILARHMPVVVLYYYRTVRLMNKKFVAPAHPMFLELEKIKIRPTFDSSISSKR
ncbi:MAG: ABC transporter substrate-binding protein [Bacteroidia bacterium]|nr:ABC transporter substrate-binding protein [Bacteroidia bacterium]